MNIHSPRHINSIENQLLMNYIWFTVGLLFVISLSYYIVWMIITPAEVYGDITYIIMSLSLLIMLMSSLVIVCYKTLHTIVINEKIINID